MNDQCDGSGFSSWEGCSARSALFEASGMFDTFLFLRSAGRCRKSDLYKGIGRGSEMALKLDRLEDAGLITQEKYDRITFLSLTEDGMRVADMIAGIQQILADIESRSDVAADRPCGMRRSVRNRKPQS